MKRELEMLVSRLFEGSDDGRSQKGLLEGKNGNFFNKTSNGKRGCLEKLAPEGVIF